MMLLLLLLKEVIIGFILVYEQKCVINTMKNSNLNEKRGCIYFFYYI